MIKIKQKTEDTHITIDLTGAGGNAFTLLGLTRKWARELRYSDAQTSALMGDMRAGDYAHLIHRFDEEFGHFVILLREEK
jgi:hypothetical protein